MRHHGRGYVFQQATLYRLGLHDIRSTCNMRHIQKYLHTIYCMLYNTVPMPFWFRFAAHVEPQRAIRLYRDWKKRNFYSSNMVPLREARLATADNLTTNQLSSMAAAINNFLMIWTENIVMQPENIFFPSSSSHITSTFYSVRSPACA